MKIQHAILAASLVFGLSAQTTEYGPGKGTLVIQGGGSAEGTGIYEAFVNLAGGPNAKIIIVPTAGGNRTKEGKLIVYEEEKIVGSVEEAWVDERPYASHSRSQSCRYGSICRNVARCKGCLVQRRPPMELR
jgi:cyanophycinase-like exopeptidase